MKSKLTDYLLSPAFLLILSVGCASSILGTALPATAAISKASQTCVECHSTETPAIVQHWQDSHHYKS